MSMHFDAYTEKLFCILVWKSNSIQYMKFFLFSYNVPLPW